MTCWALFFYHPAPLFVMLNHSVIPTDEHVIPNLFRDLSLCHADRAEQSANFAEGASASDTRLMQNGQESLRSESPTRVNVNVEFSLQVEAVAFIARRRIVLGSL